MRVIAGTLGGRRLHTPSADAFRPTTDRVREAVFNILANRICWEGAAVCDLFAGSGSMAIEALSRGAAQATCVEKSRDAVAVLRNNIEALGLGDRCRVVASPAETFLLRGDGRFRVIFADPPYAYEHHAQLLRLIADGDRLEEGGIVCLEHAAASSPQPAAPWEPADRRSYGDTAVSFFRCTPRELSRSTA